jgi:hypothetical protein
MQMQHIKIVEGGLDDHRVQALLAHHFSAARVQTAPGSAHALDLDGLRSPDIRFWSAWDGENVIGICALNRLSESDGELKSMHTVHAFRRKGVGSALLKCIINSVFMTLRLDRDHDLEEDMAEPQSAAYRRRRGSGRGWNDASAPTLA